MSQQKNLSKWVWLTSLVTVLICYAGEAAAVATCTSKATGNWGTSSTWNCVGTPAVTVPGPTNPVVLASPYTVTLNNDYTAASLTIDSGATLSDTNGNILTVTGDITNNGTFTSSNSGVIASTGAAAIISGSGTFANQARLYTSGTAPTIAAGSTLAFTGTAQIRTGRNPNGNTVSSSVLTINGTLDGSGLTSGTTFFRIYASNTVVSTTGIINAGTAIIEYRATGTLTNNGNVIIGTIRRNSGTGTWTNAANANLTVKTAFVASNMILNASATNNTVTYNSPATPITPSSNTYYNLAGTGVVCPVPYIILGTSPCVAGTYVVSSPTNCTNMTGVGTIAWTNSANAISSNNAYATASNVIRNTTTNYLNCTGFNLAVPSGATISGITVYVERKTGSGTTLKDAFVYLIKGGTISTALNGATATSYPTTDQIEAHGGQTNLWGTTWTVTDVNDTTNFGVAFAAKNTSTTSTTNRTISVDHIQIRVDYTLPALHHIRIEHDGVGSTCAPEPITLKACSNAACTTYYTGGDVTNIGLSPTGGSYTWTPGSTVSITAAGGGVNSGVALARTSNGTAALAITGSPNPMPGNTYECYNTATGSNSCNLVFSSNSFSFNVLDHTSATRQVATLTSCTSGFANKTRSIKFWSTYVNPSTGTLQGKVVAGAGNADCSTAYANLGSTSGSPTTLNLAFGAGTAPQATFSLCYPDVGQLRVDARYDGSAANGDAGVVILGNDNFIAKPDHFEVSDIKRTSDNLANPAATDATGGKFVKAGDSTVTEAQFTATITAKNALGSTTPNFGLESAPGPEGIKMTAVLVAPSGGDPGLLTCNGSTSDGCIVPGGSTNFSSGAATLTDLAWNEVGIIQLMMKMGDGDYLGTGEVSTPTPSGNIGRFYPHHFSVTPSTAMPIENRADLCQDGFLLADGVTPCSAFTYMDEPINTQFTLTAQTANNSTTQNYVSSAIAAQNFAKLDLTASGNPLGFGAVNISASPTYLNSRLDTSVNASGSFDVGVADIIAPISFTRGILPDGPYAALNIGIAPVDTDGASIVTFDLDTDVTVGDDHLSIGVTEVRHGRLKMQNAYGSELLALSVPIEAQYWNGSSFVRNINDSATSLSASNIALIYHSGGLNTTNMGTSHISINPINSGLGAINLAKPNPSAGGSINILLNLGSSGTPANCLSLPSAGSTSAAMPYLSGKWCGSVYDRDPVSRATFGIYRTPIIYIRENY